MTRGIGAACRGSDAKENMKPMTSKERVLTTLSNQEADRVPINYKAHPGIDARLKAHYGLKVGDGEGLRKILGVDFAGVEAPYVGPKLHEDVPHRQVDIWGVRTRYVEHETGGYWDFCDFPLREAGEEQVAAWPMPSPDDFDYDVVYEQACAHERYCVHVGASGLGCVINRLGKLRGMEQILVDLLTDDPAGLLLIERKQQVELEVTERSIEAGRDKIDFMWMGEDLSTQLGPMISLDLYRRHIRPWHAKFVELAKAYDLPVMLHSCGSCSWVFEDFIEMGIDGVDTLQPEAKDMSPEYLKRNFGGRLAFHGCISTAGSVAFGSVQEAVEDCRRTLEVMMPGGGYCFAPSHQLQDNSPTENVVAMYETAHRYGEY